MRLFQMFKNHFLFSNYYRDTIKLDIKSSLCKDLHAIPLVQGLNIKRFVYETKYN